MNLFHFFGKQHASNLSHILYSHYRSITVFSLDQIINITFVIVSQFLAVVVKCRPCFFVCIAFCLPKNVPTFTRTSVLHVLKLGRPIKDSNIAKCSASTKKSQKFWDITLLLSPHFVPKSLNSKKFR